MTVHAQERVLDCWVAMYCDPTAGIFTSLTQPSEHRYASAPERAQLMGVACPPETNPLAGSGAGHGGMRKRRCDERHMYKLCVSKAMSIWSDDHQYSRTTL